MVVRVEEISLKILIGAKRMISFIIKVTVFDISLIRFLVVSLS